MLLGHWQIYLKKLLGQILRKNADKVLVQKTSAIIFQINIYEKFQNQQPDIDVLETYLTTLDSILDQ